MSTCVHVMWITPVHKRLFFRFVGQMLCDNSKEFCSNVSSHWNWTPPDPVHWKTFIQCCSSAYQCNDLQWTLVFQWNLGLIFGIEKCCKTSSSVTFNARRWNRIITRGSMSAGARWNYDWIFRDEWNIHAEFNVKLWPDGNVMDGERGNTRYIIVSNVT